MTTSDPSLSQGTPAPGATTTTAPVAPAAPAPGTPPAPAPGTEPTVDPNWLKPRLERERKAALRAAGFESEADAKAAADAQRAAADAKKTAEQRATELTSQAASEKARADGLLAVATEHAARMMVGLTAEQQAAVKAIAGDDPAKQLSAIGALTPTWAKQSPTTTTTEKPATTAPAATAPNGTTPAPTDPRGVYESQRSQNPFAAASFGMANPQVYTPKQ